MNDPHCFRAGVTSEEEGNNEKWVVLVGFKPFRRERQRERD